MSVFRPSAQVTFWLRVDELNDKDPLVQQLTGSAIGPNVPPSLPEAADAGDANAQVDALNERIANIERNRALLDTLPGLDQEQTLTDLRQQRNAILTRGASPGGTSGEQTRPNTVGGPAPDGRFVRGGICPVDVEIERNSFRTADTASITLNWRDLPFDPRLVRAAGVEVVIGVVSPEDFEAGVAGQEQENGQLRSVIAQRPAGELVGSAVRFAGWVDEWGVAYDDSKMEQVEVKCRDYTALFLDTPLASNSGIDRALPIDRGVEAFINSYNSVRNFPIRYGDPNDPDREFSGAPIPAASQPTVLSSRRGRRSRQVRRGDQRMNLWDHITDVCVPVSIIPIVRDYTLWLCPPRTLYSGNTASVRRMVYGRNLTSLQFTRKLGGVKVPTIEVRSYDPSVGRMRWGRCPVRKGEQNNGIFGRSDPPRPLRANEPGISGAVPEDRIQTFVLRAGIAGDQLGRTAADLYQQIGRQEIEGNFETYDVSSWDLRAGESLAASGADLLRIESGDSIELLVAPRSVTRPEQVPNSAAELAGLSVQGRVDFLRRLGWEENVARQFAVWQEGAAFQTIFRVQNSRVSFSQASGIKVTVDFINYITVREDAALNETEANTAQAGATSRGVITLPELTISAGVIILPELAISAEPAAPEVDALTGDREDAPAQQARSASARRRSLERQRAAGQVTDQDVADAFTAEQVAVTQVQET